MLAGSAELAGGFLLGSGLVVPAAALLIVAVMTTATVAVHWKSGLWAASGGFEYPLVIAAVAFAVAALGPGSLSLDRVFGLDWAGLAWAVAAVVAGVLGGLAAVILGRVADRTQSQRREPQAQAA